MSIQLELWENQDSAQFTTHPQASIASKQAESDAAQTSETVKTDVLSTLQRQIQRIESARRPEFQAISSGIQPLDALLPQQGFPAGSLVEWIANDESSGAAWLALLAARQAHQQSAGKVVVLDCEKSFYPPAAIACGLPANAIILLRPQSRADALWAIDQSLRSSAVASVWGHLPGIDDKDARRLQLAAETGGNLGLFIRPEKAIHEPSWAEVRLHVRGRRQGANSAVPANSAHRHLSVRLLRVRGGKAGQQVPLIIDQKSGIVRRELQRDTSSAQRLAAELARSADTRRNKRVRSA